MRNTSSAGRFLHGLTRENSGHCLVTTVLPLTTGTVLRIRKPSQSDAEQQRPYDKLGIDWKAAFHAIKSTTAA